MDAVIQISDLTKYYGKHLGIKNVNLEVNKGDIFGFIGPNGAGKSTTIRLLLGFIKKTSGSAKVLGHDIDDNHLDILANIGYMQSQSNFYKDLTVKQTIELSSKLRKNVDRNYIRLLVERLEIDENKKIRELSLGNKKKLNIVLAVFHKPKLLILDEPTSGLDPLMQKKFWNIIDELVLEGSTVFLSSHVLDEVQHKCNKAAIIRKGQIISIADIQELKDSMPKRIKISGIDHINFSDGVKDLVTGDNNVSFLYTGDINALIATLSKLKIEDLNITEPDLEEVFLHYYSKEEKNANI